MFHSGHVCCDSSCHAGLMLDTTKKANPTGSWYFPIYRKNIFASSNKGWIQGDTKYQHLYGQLRFNKQIGFKKLNIALLSKGLFKFLLNFHKNEENLWYLLLEYS